MTQFRDTVAVLCLRRVMCNLGCSGVDSELPGVKVWTSPNPALNAAVVSFLPGTLNPQRLGQVLYEKDKIGLAGRGMGDRGGLRASPHFYNTPEEADRLVSAVGRYLKTGV